ncbi:hypothetical protein [Sinobacterium norvegicum]|nr:hypothetical protein [Sinobacterium norvegicum]
MAFESCPECNTEKHQLVKCPQCGFQRNPHKGPIVVDVQPQREHVSRQRDNDSQHRQRDTDGQPRQRRSQHGLRNDHRRDDRQQPHPNSYEYQAQEPKSQQPRQHNGNAMNNRRRQSSHSSGMQQPRHNQFGQPIGGTMQSSGSDQLREPRKPAKAAVITYKRKPRIIRTEGDSPQP